METASKIYLSPPHLGDFEIEYIKKAFESNWIAPIGPNIELFENKISKYLNEPVHATALNSGTAAIHLALQLLDVKEGDEVICQSFTFVATANPIIYQGAKPVFVDSELDTWNICPELLETAILDRISRYKKPKAIIAVHLYGMPYKVNVIHDIAKKYDIPIIEDSAEALGSKYNGKYCGVFGDFSAFSFNGNKIITTSGGGALITKSTELKSKSIYLASQAKENTVHYEHNNTGYNYLLSNVLAGIGVGQMEVLNNRIIARRSNFEFYKKYLSQYDDISFLHEPENMFSNRWLSCLITTSFELREQIRLELEQENIESKPLWKPLHLQPVFKDCLRFTNNVSENLFDTGLCLPSGSNLNQAELIRIVSTISKVLENK
ncbi:DegT/DnrJ/EryC1/StrS family aminotransferase [Gaetbulibacter saemankumensis]|uniref:DegT/DnrJ/EryC1/StrS family aminotransferase n=1 Tax=Gaetbulibacter saemankumensis TaxID=311208 RepID=UPI00040B735D|nr:DegT/DnrJ/EryC1/StrS family aminotransferase [Gaetbulibacter saemankumensis]